MKVSRNWLIHVHQVRMSHLERTEFEFDEFDEPHRSSYEDSVTVHAALQSLGRQRGTRYQHHSATMNSLSCHFVAS